MNVAEVQKLYLGFGDQLPAFRLRRGSRVEGNISKETLYCLTMGSTGALHVPVTHPPVFLRQHSAYLAHETSHSRTERMGLDRP